MSASKKNIGLIISLSGGILFALIFALFVGSFASPYLKASNQYPSSSPPDPYQDCLLRCGVTLDNCEDRANKQHEICQEIIFEDGLDNCYGPDGKLIEGCAFGFNECDDTHLSAILECSNNEESCKNDCTINHLGPNWNR